LGWRDKTNGNAVTFLSAEHAFCERQHLEATLELATTGG
jgi:hypothetical protein